MMSKEVELAILAIVNQILWNKFELIGSVRLQPDLIMETKIYPPNMLPFNPKIITQINF